MSDSTENTMAAIDQQLAALERLAERNKESGIRLLQSRISALEDQIQWDGVRLHKHRQLLIRLQGERWGCTPVAFGSLNPGDSFRTLHTSKTVWVKNADNTASTRIVPCVPAQTFADSDTVWVDTTPDRDTIAQQADPFYGLQE